jgi:hypothetical protein
MAPAALEVTIFASLKKMVKLPRTLFFLFLVLWFA